MEYNKLKLNKVKCPIVINLNNSKYSVIQKASKQLGLTKNYEDNISKSILDWDIKWSDISLGSEIVKKMTKNQRINYFIGISSIARKNLLMVNLYTMKKYFPQDYDFFPQTFQYPLDYKKIVKYHKQRVNEERKTTFIVKPEASCQGRGIYLCQHLNEIQTQSKAIVQEYISEPMLYQGLKFDFRVYVLLKSVAPLEIYIYKEGLVRFATEEYEEPSKANLDNLCLHLTNYAVNKLNPKYEFNQTMSNLNYGHKKSLAEFFKSLQSKGCNSYRCWRQIKECIVKTIISVQPHLHAEYRKAQPKNQSEGLCFQVLGFDFMMNKDSKVYLLEVNQSPSFSTQTPLDFLIKSFLIKDTLKIIIFDKERRKRDSEFRSKRVKTQNDDNNDDNLQNSESSQLPSSVLGNYECIFPASNETKQKLYENMLLYIKADYHKTRINQTPGAFMSLSPLKEKSISPQLKIKLKSTGIYSEKLLIKDYVSRSQSMERRIGLNKKRAQLLHLSSKTRNFSIDRSFQNFPSITKQADFPLSPNPDHRIKARRILSLNLSPPKNQKETQLIHRTLTCPRQTDSHQLSLLSDKDIAIKVLSNKYFAKKQEKVHVKATINQSVSISVNQITQSRVSNQRSAKLSWYKDNFSSKKEAFRCELKKYVKYLNPIENAPEKRVQTQNENRNQVLNPN